MRVCELEIKNFRGIKGGRIHFRKNAVLLGPNNCGKSTIADALVLLLRSDRRSGYWLSEHDFHGGNPDGAIRRKYGMVETFVT